MTISSQSFKLSVLSVLSLQHLSITVQIFPLWHWFLQWFLLLRRCWGSAEVPHVLLAAFLILGTVVWPVSSPLWWIQEALFSLFSFILVVRMEWQRLSSLCMELETRIPIYNFIPFLKLIPSNKYLPIFLIIQFSYPPFYWSLMPKKDSTDLVYSSCFPGEETRKPRRAVMFAGLKHTEDSSHPGIFLWDK